MQKVKMDLGIADVAIPEALSGPQPKPARGRKKKAPPKKGRSKAHITINHPQFGSMEIRQMRGALMGDTCDLSATLTSTNETSPVWTQIAKQGRFLGHSAGQFEMNLQTFEEVIRNFKAHPEAIPFDFEHASESDASSGSIPTHGAPAQGWITDLKIENGNLYGLVEWGALARQYIKEGKYRHVSPALRFGSKDRVTGKPIGARLSSCALTNQPFLSGLERVAARDTEHDLEREAALEEDEDDLTDEGVDEGDSPEESDEDASSQEKIDMADKEYAVMLSEAQARSSELQVKLSSTEGKVAVLEAKCAAQEAELKALKDKEDERYKVEVAADVDTAISTYSLKAENRDTFLSFALSDRPGFNKIYPKIEPAKAHLLRNHTELTREAPPAAATAPVHINLAAAARQYASQTGMSLANAQIAVVRMRDKAAAGSR